MARLTLSLPRAKAPSPLLKRLLPITAGSLLGLLAGGALLQHAQQQSASEQRQQLTDAWTSGQLGALQRGLQRLIQDTQAAAALPELGAGSWSGR